VLLRWKLLHCYRDPLNAAVRALRERLDPPQQLPPELEERLRSHRRQSEPEADDPGRE